MTRESALVSNGFLPIILGNHDQAVLCMLPAKMHSTALAFGNGALIGADDHAALVTFPENQPPHAQH